MRVDVTPLGGAGRTVGQVAAAVVEYLEGGVGDAGSGLLTEAAGDGLVSYYGDSKESPGRWLGSGAAARGLTGVVDRAALARVLEGRHPETGARLLTAQGSSQRGHLATGTAARFDEWGQPLYSIADTARLVGWTHAEVGSAVADGTISTIEADGERFVRDTEITRLVDAASTSPVERITAGGSPDDWLSGPHIARLLGVSARYVRRLCGRDEQGVAGDAVARLRSERVGDNGAFRIRRRDLAEFAANRTPPVARVGYDITLTTEKSFGVVMMLTDADRQRRFVDARRTANGVAIDHLDRHASVARRRGDVVATHGLVAATYFHGTSRGLDPHPHHHNVVANAVIDDTGGVRALDARALYLHAAEAAALATAAARWELHDLGLGWWQRDDGIWEIAGVDDAVIDAFSSRHRDIREVRDALETQLGRPVTASEEQRIWSDTRADKTAVNPAELLADWRRRATSVGFDVDTCFDRRDRALVCERLDASLTSRLFADLVDPEHGLCAHSDRFERGDVVRAIADWAIDERGVRRKLLLPPDEIGRLAGRFLSHHHVIGLSAALSRGAIHRRDGTVFDGGQLVRTYTTAEMVWTQGAILDAWRNGHSGGHGVIDPATIDAACDATDTVTLSEEQRHLVVSWCTSGDRVQGAVGRAGTGKTTAMAAAARAWEAAGYRVIGAAVKAEAAHCLGTDAGIEADTLALLLARLRRHEPVLDTRTVVIVDEASTIGDRELLELLLECDALGATLRLIGDPAQHRAVTAGGCWAWLVAHHDNVPELATVHRLRDHGERRNAEAVRSNLAADVIAQLEAAGQLVWSDNDHATYAAMMQRWYHNRTDAPHPMVHGRNRQRRLLNHIAQQVLIADGTVNPERSVTLRDGRRLCVGDEIIARHGDRRIHPAGNPTAWMRNGTTGHITNITATDGGAAVTIRTGTGDEFVVDRAAVERRRGGIDLAYAVTSYAVQGATRDHSTSAVTATTTKAELYVDITRGRSSNLVYATRTIAPATGETDRHMPVIERSLADELRNRLNRADATPVVIADRHLRDLAPFAGMSLAKLHAEQRTGQPGPWDEAIERREATLATTTPIPEQFHTILPELPDVPHLLARCQRLAGQAAIWTETHNPARPRRNLTPLETALAPRPNAPGMAQGDWDHLAHQLTRLAVDATIHHLADRHPQLRAPAHDSDSWLGRWLHHAADHGHLAQPRSERLGHVLAAIAEWRDRHHVDPDHPSPLGPPPHDPNHRAEHHALTARLAELEPTRAIEPELGIV